MTEAVIPITRGEGRKALSLTLRALHTIADPQAQISAIMNGAAMLAGDTEAIDRITETALALGHDPDVVQAAIARGVQQGRNKKGRRQMKLIPLSEINPTPVRWLWPDRVARKFVLFCGPPDVGKTTAAIDVAARVSRGDPWPDGSGNAPLGSVLYMTAEDGAADTIRTRAEAAGADLSRVHVLETVTDEHGKASSFNMQRDLDLLADHVRRIGDVALIVVDPISAYLGDGKDSHKASDVRSILGPLKDFSDDHGVAVIGLAHPSKSVDRAMNAVGGSGAFVAAARAAWLFVREVDDDGQETGRTIMAGIKNNLSALRNNGLAYGIVGADIGNGISAPRVSWDGEVNLSADQALAMTANAVGRAGNGEGDGDAIATAMRIIEEEFLVSDRIDASDLVTWAKRAGISEKTLRTARSKLGVVAKRDGFGPGSKFYLSLPNRRPIDAL